MAGFNDLGNPRVAFDRKLVVYLEGKDDLEVVEERWFGDREDFSDVQFESAGGCTEVTKFVEGCDPFEWPQVFGIVDRDALLKSCRAAGDEATKRLLNTDDDEFRDSSPCERLGVLTYWEIENYLLGNIDVLSKKIHDWSGHRPHRLARWLCLRGQNVAAYTAANICLHFQGVAKLADEFEVSGEHAKVCARMEKQTTNQNASTADWQSIWPQVKAFDDDPHASHPRRWSRLLRLVDGKRMLLEIIMNKNFKGKGDKISMGSARRTLASAMAERRDIPREFIELIDSFRSIADRIADTP